MRTLLLRKSFKTKGKLVKAIVQVSAIGVVEFSINGVKVGNEFLALGPSQFEKCVFYSNFDVTNKITIGKNMLGLWLAEGQAAITNKRLARSHNLSHQFQGSHKNPLAILSLALRYANGQIETRLEERIDLVVMT